MPPGPPFRVLRRRGFRSGQITLPPNFPRGTNEDSPFETNSKLIPIIQPHPDTLTVSRLSPLPTPPAQPVSVPTGTPAADSDPRRLRSAQLNSTLSLKTQLSDRTTVSAVTLSTRFLPPGGYSRSTNSIRITLCQFTSPIFSTLLTVCIWRKRCLRTPFHRISSER